MKKGVVRILKLSMMAFTFFWDASFKKNMYCILFNTDKKKNNDTRDIYLYFHEHITKATSYA